MSMHILTKEGLLVEVPRLKYPAMTPHEYADLIAEARHRFASCIHDAADQECQDDIDWLTFWSGPQWGDEAPNRLFGAWLNQDGEAV